MAHTDDETMEETSNEEGVGSMKVPIDEPAAETDFEELDEEAMVEAAIRAGEQAAEEELAQAAADECERAKAERDELLGQLEEATTEVGAAKKEAQDAVDRLTRLQADWENFRRRTNQERAVEKERAAEKLVLGLLPVLDDMERAVDHARSTEAENEQLIQFVDGVSQIHDKMVGILAKQGVEVIDPVGEPFEPLSHQAVGREENAEAFDETVAQVYQRGYRLGGKVIRPAMVTVTFGGPKRPTEEAEGAEDASDGEN